MFTSAAFILLLRVLLFSLRAFLNCVPNFIKTIEVVETAMMKIQPAAKVGHKRPLFFFASLITNVSLSY